MISEVKLLLKGEVGVCASNSNGNFIVDHGKSWKNYGIVFLNFCGNHGLYVCKFICSSFHHVRGIYNNILVKVSQVGISQ